MDRNGFESKCATTAGTKQKIQKGVFEKEGCIFILPTESWLIKALIYLRS